MKGSAKDKLEKCRGLLKQNRQALVMGIVCLVLATFFVTIRSWSTSFLYPDYLSYGGDQDNGDSMQFMTMGKMWLAGKVPYAEFFDHKGPLVFFFDMLGLLIGGGSRYGLMVLQIIAMAVTFFYILKICRLAAKESLWGWMVLAVTMVYMAASYASGNSVQEWNLPFLAVAIYYMVKYFYADKREQREHNPKYALVYGVAVGVCLLAQASHAIFLCAGILVIFINLAIQKKWQNIGKNILYGLAGVLVTILPFVFYFALTGVLGDFFYYTFIYNLFYAANIGSWLKGATAGDVVTFCLVYVPFFCGILAAALAWMRGKRPYAMVLALAWILEAYLFFSAQAFPHYVLPFIFQLPLFLNEVYLIRQADEAWKLLRLGIIMIFLIATYDVTNRQIIEVASTYNAVRAAGEQGIGYESILERHQNALQDNTLTIYGANEVKGTYLYYDIIPYNRFFVIQGWHASMNETLAKEIQEDFRENRAEYILTDGAYDSGEYNINGILDEYYAQIDRDGNYKLYQLK